MDIKKLLGKLAKKDISKVAAAPWELQKGEDQYRPNDSYDDSYDDTDKDEYAIQQQEESNDPFEVIDNPMATPEQKRDAALSIQKMYNGAPLPKNIQDLLPPVAATTPDPTTDPVNSLPHANTVTDDVEQNSQKRAKFFSDKPDWFGEKWSKISGLSEQINGFYNMYILNPDKFQAYINREGQVGQDAFQYAITYLLGDPKAKKDARRGDEGFSVDQRIGFFKKNLSKLPKSVISELKENNLLELREDGKYGLLSSIKEKNVTGPDPENSNETLPVKIPVNAPKLDYSLFKKYLHVREDKYGNPIRELRVDLSSTKKSYSKVFKFLKNIEDEAGNKKFNAILKQQKPELLKKMNDLIYGDGTASDKSILKYIRTYLGNAQLNVQNRNISKGTRNIDVTNTDGVSNRTLAVDENDPPSMASAKEEAKETLLNPQSSDASKVEAYRLLEGLDEGLDSVTQDMIDNMNEAVKSLLGIGIEQVEQNIINEPLSELPSNNSAWTTFSSLKHKEIKSVADLGMEVAKTMRQMADKRNPGGLDHDMYAKADFVEMISQFSEKQVRGLMGRTMDRSEIDKINKSIGKGQEFSVKGSDGVTIKFYKSTPQGVFEIKNYSKLIKPQLISKYLSDSLNKKKAVLSGYELGKPSQQIAKELEISEQEVERTLRMQGQGVEYFEKFIADRPSPSDPARVSTLRERAKNFFSDVAPAVLVSMVKDQNGKEPSQHKYPPSVRRNFMDLIGYQNRYLGFDNQLGGGRSSWLKDMRAAPLLRTILGYHKSPDPEEKFNGEALTPDSWEERKPERKWNNALMDYGLLDKEKFPENWRTLASGMQKIKTAYVKESSTLIKIKKQMSKYNYAHSSMKFIDEKISILQDKYASIVRKHIEKAYADKHS